MKEILLVAVLVALPIIGEFAGERTASSVLAFEIEL